MSRRHRERGTARTGGIPPRSRMRTATRLTIMIAVIVALASFAVWQRMRLTPAWALANPLRAGLVASPMSQLLQLIDTERQRAGCAALKLSDPLTASAEAHAADMAARGYASEFSPDGAGPQERAASAGYPGHVAEIIAAGIPTSEAVFAQWINRGNTASAGIVAKMTDCSYVSAGIGYAPARVMPTFQPGIWVVDLGDR